MCQFQRHRHKKRAAHAQNIGRPCYRTHKLTADVIRRSILVFTLFLQISTKKPLIGFSRSMKRHALYSIVLREDNIFIDIVNVFIKYKNIQTSKE